MTDTTDISQLCTDTTPTGGIQETIGGKDTALGGKDNVAGGDAVADFVAKKPILIWVMIVASIILVIILLLLIFKAYHLCKTCATVASFVSNFESQSLNSIQHHRPGQSQFESQSLNSIQHHRPGHSNFESMSLNTIENRKSHMGPPPPGMQHPSNLRRPKSHMTPSGTWRYTDGDAGSNPSIDVERKSGMTPSGTWRYTDGDAGSNPTIDVERKSGMAVRHYREANPIITDATNWQQVGAQRQYFENPPQQSPQVIIQSPPVVVQSPQNPPVQQILPMQQPMQQPVQQQPSVVVVQSPPIMQSPPIVMQQPQQPQMMPQQQHAPPMVQSNFCPEHFRSYQENATNKPNNSTELFRGHQEHATNKPNNSTELFRGHQEHATNKPNNSTELFQEHVRNRRQHMTPNKQQTELYTPRSAIKSHATIMPGSTQPPPASANNNTTNTNASMSTLESDLAGCSDSTWNDYAADEARTLASMGVYAPYTPGDRMTYKAINSNNMGAMTDDQLVSIMFGGSATDATKSGFTGAVTGPPVCPPGTTTTVTENKTNVPGCYCPTGYNWNGTGCSVTTSHLTAKKNYFANVESQYDTLSAMHGNYDRENPIIPYA